MSLLNKFKTDVAKEQEGVWNDFDNTFRIRIARTCKNNKRYTKELEKAMQPYRRTIDSMSNETGDMLLRTVFSRTIVTGWQTMVDGQWRDGIDLDGTGLLPPTPENISAVFEQLPDLFETVQQIANAAINFRDAALEQEAKN